MTQAAVSVSRDGDIVHVTLTRPDKLNSFNADLVAGLQSTVDQAGESGARLLVFRGDGRGFSGGFDLGDLERLSDGDLLHRFVKVEELLQSVFHARFATLALVHGACYGAAADLVAACRYRVATSDAKFRMPGALFGVVLGTQRLVRLVGSDTARALLFRNSAFDSTEALKAGFVSEVSEQETWSTIAQDQLQAVRIVAPATYSLLSERIVEDTRDADLAALVRSVSNGSIKQRIEAYLKKNSATRAKF